MTKPSNTLNSGHPSRHRGLTSRHRGLTSRHRGRGVSLATSAKNSSTVVLRSDFQSVSTYVTD